MNNPNNQGQQTKKQQDAAPGDLKRIKISIDALTDEIKAQRREQSERERENPWPKRTAIAAIIYTVFTFLVLLINGWQNYLIRSNNVVSERAFISLGFAVGSVSYGESMKQKMNVGDVMAALNEGGADVTNLSFIANLTNSGNTGTRNLTFFAKCAPSTERLQDPWPLLYQGVNNPTKTPQYLGPHATAQTVCGFNGDQIRAMIKGTLFGYIMLEAIYQDRFVDEWHKTQATATIAQIQFVPTIEPNGLRGVAPAVALATYGAHNCADEECP